jgi:hydrogenase expression/formation protein HypD
VIFLGVGFETTAPTIAVSLLRFPRLANYFVLAAHKTIPIPMQVLSADPELGIDGYICPPMGTIIGAMPMFSGERSWVPVWFRAGRPHPWVEMLVRQIVENGRSEIRTAVEIRKGI